MKLRTRLLVTSLVVVIPLAIVLFVIDDRLRGADQLERLTEFARTEMTQGVYERCVDNGGMRGRPPRGGGPGRGGPGRGGRNQEPRSPGPSGPGSAAPDRPAPPPPRGGGERPYDLLSYGADFTPSAINVPPLDDALKTALATNDMASGPFTSSDGRGMQLAVWLNRADAHCAVLLLQLPPRRGELRDRAVAMLLILFSVIAATWLAAGPVLRRLSRLASAVHRSADTRYETPVQIEGGDEVAVLATAFNEAGARVRSHLLELQQREDSLRQFVANTAHDVGLPLTVLQGHLAELEASHGRRTSPVDLKVHGYEDLKGQAAEDLKGQGYEDLNGQAAEDLKGQGYEDLKGQGAEAREVQGSEEQHIRDAMREAHYLGSLIRNLNAATRLDAVNTPIERHDVDLGALVERVASRHRVVARARNVELNHAVPETPVIVSAEVTLLEQAVGNLVDNAIRHNHANGHVALVLDQTERGFTITVIDDGPGVKDEDLARLTERWFRGDDARTRRPDGQGLGLAIASESVKRLGWTLTFSRPSEGGLAATISGAV